jgi:hypothetical protein
MVILEIEKLALFSDSRSCLHYLGYQNRMTSNNAPRDWNRLLMSLESSVPKADDREGIQCKATRVLCSKTDQPMEQDRGPNQKLVCRQRNQHRKKYEAKISEGKEIRKN